MNITKEQFRQYVIDCKGYGEDMVKEIFAEMRTFGTPLCDYLTQEEVAECIAYNV